MNKKFSTLAVAAMLASAFTAYAGPGEVVTKLAEGNNGKQYQLRVYDNDTKTLGDFLVLKNNETTGDVELVIAKKGSSDYVLGNSLWCVDVTLENQGKNPIFDFINKGQKAILDVTVGGYSDGNVNEWKENNGIYYGQKVAHVGGEVAGWEFAPVLGSDDVAMFGVKGQASNFVGEGTAYSLNSYIDSNMAATLVYENGEVKVAVAPADKLNSVENQVKFFLQEADAIDLTASEFNSILNTQNGEKGTVKLTFDKDYNNTEIVNPFSTNELRALDVVDGAFTRGHNFVYLYKTEADGSENYLRVDTAYANGFGTKFLTFAFGSEFRTYAENNAKSKNLEDEAIIPGQYQFRLNYCPTDDSLSIQVMSALYKLKDDVRAWSNLTSGTTYGKLEVAVENEDYVVTTWTDTKADDKGNSNHPSGLLYHQTNWVKLQDLETATESRIITVGDAPINTHISFGFGGCSDVKAEYTSVADGVYVIKNAQGQVLASPLYKNGSEALFVSVDEQDPEHMPAYQWVVLTNYTQEKSLPTSPVTITNREFPALQSSMQLREKDGASYMYTLNATNSNANAVVTLVYTDSLKFEKVADTYVKDKYLGYKKITKDSLTVNKYTFNYWHPYASDKFIAKSSKDSTLTVLEGKDAFVVDTLAWLGGNKAYSTVDVKYGFGKAKVRVNGSDLSLTDVRKRIPGLAQLVRTVYEMKDGGINDEDATTWKVNNNDQFNLGVNYINDTKTPWVDNVQDVQNYYVFFKENNHIDGKHYYALVNAVLNGTGTEYIIGVNKAGVSDYDAAATLKNQPLWETRTSSFVIDRDDTPLYRRFNSAALEGQAGDGVDTLRFYEKYRNEYLMIEANPSFMVEHIDFLGINAQDKAQGGLAFIVDTAWVNRGAGHIKPQYLISIDRHDYDGVAGEPCTEAGPHIDESGHITDDPYECVHAHKAVPGFKRGKFLINFHNFADEDANMVNADDYKWAEYDRAGFKEAIIVKDTMYILRDEFKNLANEEIDLAKLASAEVEALRAWTSADAANNKDNFLSYRYELTGDNHKYVTWSMRFVDRSVAANEVEADRAFLFESMGYNADIAPTKAAWLKMQNGCLVLSDEKTSEFDEVVTGGDDALIFNVEHVCGDKVAVDNENIAVEGVSVVAGNGQVTIMGAAGKNVTITNILGKVIANQTIASDNATIAVPAGIVAVAVEGEAAVKAIVK